MKSYYDLLALPQNATTEQIRSRFMELVRQRHPDRFQGAEKVSASASPWDGPSSVNRRRS